MSQGQAFGPSMLGDSSVARGTNRGVQLEGRVDPPA